MSNPGRCSPASRPSRSNSPSTVSATSATSIVSFLLLPVYVRYLSPEDYGVIGLLLTVEVVAKILVPLGRRRLVHAAVRTTARTCRRGSGSSSTHLLVPVGLNGVLLAVGAVRGARDSRATCSATSATRRCSGSC